MGKSKVTTLDMELTLSLYFKYLRNLVVPNVSWGMGLHECDLLVVTKAGYATEVEIKISKADLVKDKKKYHNHDSDKIKYLYFAIPDYLQEYIEHIPKRAGIIVVGTNKDGSLNKRASGCNVIRKAEVYSDYKFSAQEMYKVARLGALRIWSLKTKIQKLKKGK